MGFRRAGMQADAHAHGTDLAPDLVIQRALRLQSRGERITRIGEDRAERVADHLKHVPVIRLDRALQQRMMARERVLCGIRVLLDQSRRAFDIGEQEGDGATGQADHSGNMGRAWESKRWMGRASLVPISTETAGQRKRPLGRIETEGSMRGPCPGSTGERALFRRHRSRVPSAFETDTD